MLQQEESNNDIDIMRRDLEVYEDSNSDDLL